MSKVWLVTLGSHGDVHPFVGIAQCLQQRGHEPTLLAADHFASLAQNAGLPFVPIGEPGLYDRLSGNADLWHKFRGAQTVLKLAVSAIEPVFAALDERAREGDIVIASMLAVGARVFREVRNVRLITAHLQPMALRGLEDPPRVPGMPHLPWLWPAMRSRVWRMADLHYLDTLLAAGINEVRAKHNLTKPVVRVMHKWWHSPDLVLGLWPEWFAHWNLGWPENIQLTGFPLYDESDITPHLPAELNAFLRSGTPPVAFTPGSAMKFGRSFFDAAAKACARLNRRGLLLTRHDEQVPVSLPDGVIHVPFAPFSKLLPHVACLVHHGGIGTMSQAFAAGVPQLVMPMAHDQFDNAARAKRLGVGEIIPRSRFTPRRVTRQLRRLLDNPSVLASAKRLEQNCQGVDSIARACDAIETVTATPEMQQR